MPAVLAAPIVLSLLAPLALMTTVLVDLVSGPRRMAATRTFAMVWSYSWLEASAVVLAGLVWIGTGFGRQIESPRSQRLHHRIEAWWVGAILRAAERTTGLRLRIDGLEQCRDGPLVVVFRHACVIDATLPAYLFAQVLDRPLQMVLKDDLRWLPSLDVVGHRLRNHFVDRDPAHRERELTAVAQLADGRGPRDSLSIYPEGTYRSPRSWARAMERLTDQDPERAARMAGLRHLLPPRPGGTIALLQAAPEADVAVVGHAGLEHLWNLREVMRRLPFRTPIDVKVWRVPRSELPESAEDLERWLDDRWLVLDDWIDATLTDRAAAPRFRGVPATETVARTPQKSGSSGDSA